MAARNSVPGFPPHEWGAIRGGIERSATPPPTPFRARESDAEAVFLAGHRGSIATRRMFLSAVAVCAVGLVGLVWALTFPSSQRFNPFSRLASVTGWFTANTDDRIDERLQAAATRALGSRSGTIIIMDPQTGRIRACG